MSIRLRSWRPLACAMLLLACREPIGGGGAAGAVSAPGARRALLIGIDDYSASRLDRCGRDAADDERSWPALRGAVRDVQLMRQMLETRYGFQPRDIVMLTNQNATGLAIVQSIERHLIAPARKDDVILFYYAGHGSQVLNTASAELDKRDESIVPADSPLGVDDIRDKQLSQLFNRILDHGARLTVIVDSCHSGSAVRGLEPGAEARGVSPDLRDVRDGGAATPPENRGALVLSAAKDFARAYEAKDDEGKYHGVFSWAWLRAMRDSAPDEAAEDTFLRAQALMRAESPFQDPVMSGNAVARLTPFLRARQRPSAAPMTIAVEQVLDDGTVILQGGWAHGLTIGTELRPRNDKGSGQTVQIMEMLGLNRSRARVLGFAGFAQSAFQSGALLEIATWAAPPGPPLRVWVPAVDDVQPALDLARQLKAGAARQGIVWISDPTGAAPTHLLRWGGEGWELVESAHIERFPRGAAAAEILAKIRSGSSLFVQLPASAALLREIAIGPQTESNGVEPTGGPEDADYVLVGRLSEDSMEYAWVRPAVQTDDRSDNALPVRTDWQSPAELRDAALVLRHAVLRIRKILAWHLLRSPPESLSPYRLLLIHAKDNEVVDDGKVVGLERYRLVLRLLPESIRHAPQRRHYYAFGIDSFGRSVLLFPLHGSVENTFPVEVEGEPPATEITIGSMTVTPPYGLDTYFLISTEEALPNPSILAWTGVRTRGPRGETPLEELLARTGGSLGSTQSFPVPPKWSIDRLIVESVPPR